MFYPNELIGWLVDLLPREFKWTPLEILELEHQYPGIIKDIDLERWYRGLILKALKEQGKGA